MKQIHFFGKRGMGDIVATLSYFLKYNIKTDCHLIFHYPPNHGYPSLIRSIMEAFCETDFKVTYEVDETWYSISDKPGRQKFGTDGEHKPSDSDANNVWWFTGSYFEHAYWNFKKTWKGNKKGPIGIVLNHEFFNENHPIVNKFFDEDVNNFLKSLIDNVNYISLGAHHTFEKNIDVLSECRYVVGLEGGWTHVCSATRTPFVLATNRRAAIAPIKVHRGHPCLKVIETWEMYPYLQLHRDMDQFVPYPT